MASHPWKPGTRFGKYQILSHIATGGMGAVYKALDTELGRTVALKVLPPEVASRPAAEERFRREARHAARLTHPNIVTLYDFGQVEGTWFLAMEYVEGVDLATYIVRKGQLDPEEARRILIQAVKALDHAYQAGIVHRDIKPSNFLLTQQEGRAAVKMTDLGLARMESEEQYRVTRDGSTVGTVDSLSPEQARDSAAADVRSDIYSLGCTFYHMLAGHPPFAEGGLGERVYKHMEVEPPDVRQFNPHVPPATWAVLRRMLAKKPEDRYQTPAELLQALKAIKPGTQVDLSPGETQGPESGVSRGAGGEPASEPPSSRNLGSERRRERSRHRRPEVGPGAEEKPAAVEVPPELRQAAAAQYERARQAQDAGNEDYALELLTTCCKLDPGNLLSRQTLREVGRSVAEKKGSGGWLGSLTSLPLRAKFKAAVHRGDHRKVLEYGEELLARHPDEVGTQVSMGEAAGALGLVDLGIWMLEQAREQEARDPAVNRALARLYEQQGRYSRAMALWELVRKVDPTDVEAPRKINALAAKEAIARGHYDL